MPALLLVVFALAALGVYAPALRGEFLSDDLGYIVANPWVRSLGADSVRAMFDPFGPATAYTANYAPVHLLTHAIEWSVFGPATLGWHVVNVLLHAGASTLLVPVFVRAGIPRRAAVLGALVFLVHPANVEAVAWISQRKTILSLGFGVAALLLHPTRPALGTVAFGLGLLSKTTAAFALPVAAWFALLDARAGRRDRSRFAWLALWGVLLALYALPQLLAFERLGEATTPGASLPPAEHLRTLVAIGARYLVMAASSYGVAAFHHPAPAASWLDPWWLLGLALALPLALRAGRALAGGRLEGGYWLWAAAAYAPVSQVFPFLYPMADRYLYVVLPGLLGVALLAAQEVAWLRRPTPKRVASMFGIGVVALFAAQSFERAYVFRSNASLMTDSALRYPDGIAGSLFRARRAAQEGDAEAAADAVRRAAAQGFDGFAQLEQDPGLANVRHDPRFREAVREVAGSWIEIAHARGYGSAQELRMLAKAHAARGEWALAVSALERAVPAGGALPPDLERELSTARRAAAAQEGRPRAAQEDRDGATPR